MPAIRLSSICGCLALATAAACSDGSPAGTSPQTASNRPYLLERVDDAAVVQLYADDFAKRPLKDRILMWHLAQAAIAGRDIFYDQQSANGLEMRELIEAVISHPTSV